MSKGAYIGIEGVARKVKDIYIGVDGVARKVKMGYVGVDGVARLFYDTTSKIIRNGSISLYTTLPYKAGYMAVALFEQYDYFYFFGGQTAYITGTSDTGVATFSNQGKDIALMYPSLPAANYGMAYATVGSKVYMFGGDHVDTITVFDDDTLLMRTFGTWDYGYSAAAALGNKVYLFGGQKHASTNYMDVAIFDTESETIKTISKEGYPHGNKMAPVVIGKKIYVFGGVSGTTRKLDDSIYVFDTEDESYTILNTKLPVVMCEMAAAAVGTKVYLFGGKSYDAKEKITYLDSIYVFDTEYETITMLSTKLPTAASGMAAAASGSKVYLFGGNIKSGIDAKFLDKIYVFDTEG